MNMSIITVYNFELKQIMNLTITRMKWAFFTRNEKEIIYIKLGKIFITK
jgi:hypothetical protein